MQLWKTLARTPILERGKFLVVEEHRVELPDGRVIPNWDWIITPDYINVCAVTDDGRFICFRQVKYAIAGTSLAPVGGYLEPGEDPQACAQRELCEETGYAARVWLNLGSYCVDGNRGGGVGNLFLALGAHPVAARHADDLEEQELLLLTRAQVEAALDAGEFRVLAWATVMALGLRTLDRTQSKGGTMPEIKTFPRTHVVSIGEMGPWNEAIPRGFAKLFVWLGAHRLVPLGNSFGIFYDDPAKVPVEKLRCELCVPVAEGATGSDDVTAKEIAAFEAATIVYRGHANITAAYNEVYDWLRAQGYRDAGAPIEVYLSKPGEELCAQVFVPIKPAKPAPKKKAAPKKLAAVNKVAAKKPAAKKPAPKK